MEQNRDSIFRCLLINGITYLIVGIETGSRMEFNPFHTPFPEKSSNQFGNSISSGIYAGKSN